MSKELTLDFYKALSKSDLIKICKEEKIRGFSGLTKPELIELIAKRKNIPVPMSKPKASFVTAELVNLVCQRLDKEGSQDIQISLCEQLKDILEGYDFSSFKSIENDARTRISQIVSRSKLLTPVVVKTEVPIKKEYKKKKIAISFTKTEEICSDIKQTCITLKELREEINNDSFISQYVESLKKMIEAKKEIYKERIKELKSGFNIIEAKIKKLKGMGMDDKTIRDTYPTHDNTKIYIVDMEDIVEHLTSFGKTLSDKSVKQSLLSAIYDRDYGLDSLVGREDVKDQIAVQIYSFSKGYQTFIRSFNNLAIYGGSGVGKTALAKVLGFVYAKLGILTRGHVKVVTRTDLVGQYIGQTAPRTRNALNDTLEGILFIDEAYQIAPKASQNSKDFGQECITEIVNFLDKYVGLSIVIVAGYEKQMREDFMSSNEGIPRRFPHEIILGNYSPSELTDIFFYNLQKNLSEDVVFDENVQNLVFSILTKVNSEIPMALEKQAGDILNMVSIVVKTINGSYKHQWSEKYSSNKKIILEGVQIFLKRKGYDLYV